MTETFGVRPRPWVIAKGVDEDSDLGRVIKNCVDVVTFVSDEKLVSRTVRQIEYDAIVVLGDVNEMPAAHLFVLQFGGRGETEFTGARHLPQSPTRDRVSTESVGVAKLFSGADEGVSERVRVLARPLADWLLAQDEHQLIKRLSARMNATFPSVSSNDIDAFVSEAAGYPCAGRWKRDELDGDRPTAEWWWLPYSAPGRQDWLEAALEDWRSVSSRQFPKPADNWIQMDQWRTTDERSAQERVEQAQLELKRLVESHEKSINTRLTELRVATEAASNGLRRLLTGQGAELQSAVQDALVLIGFDVENVDERRSKAGSALMEDLRVSDGDWCTLTEVRSYSKGGGKTSDFQRIARAVSTFEREEGRLPDARWYVLNHHMESPPPIRPPALRGSGDDVAEFAKDGGLVIDTRDLFTAVRAVTDGSTSADELRRIFRESSGHFTWPAADSTDHP